VELKSLFGAQEQRWIEGHASVMAELVAGDDQNILDGKRRKLESRAQMTRAETVPTRSFPTENRVVVEDSVKERISDVNIRTLSHGPNFVFRPKVSETTIRDVGVAVERMAFGKRWVEHIKSARPDKTAGPKPNEAESTDPQSKERT